MLLLITACSASDAGANAPERFTWSTAKDAAVRVLSRVDPRASNEPDVVLLSARAYLQLGYIDSAYWATAEELLTKLVSIEHEGGGWGLSYPWDAFQDGVVNPADTVYSYTTAAAGLAFLDGYEILGDERWLEVAARAARLILADTCCWDDGVHASVWYSDQANDQIVGKQIHNVSGWSLALLERLDHHGVAIDRGLADRIAQYLIDTQGEGFTQPEEAAASNWVYSVRGDVANDLLHEVFIAEGLFWHRDGEAAARASISGMLEVHFDAKWQPAETRHTLGSQHWGPPAALYLLTGVEGYEQQAGRIAEVLTASVTAEGESTLVGPDRDRGLSWYALALSRWAAVHMTLDE